jgi:flagellar biogenesis protein FliO
MADASVLTILLRLAGAVIVVIGLMFLAARTTRRLNGTARTFERNALSVVSRQPLTKSASIAVVRSGTRTLILGVTDSNVTLLSEHTTSTAQDEHEELISAHTGPQTSPESMKLRSIGRKTLNVVTSGVEAVNDGTPGTALRGARRPSPPRTNFVEAMRERTVRRS